MFFLLLIVGVFSRWIPHLPGLTALVAVSIWSPIFVRSRLLAVMIPISALLLPDLFMGFQPQILSVYLPIFAVLGLGFLFRPRESTATQGDTPEFNRRAVSLTRAFAFTTGSGLAFFVLSNFGVWVEGELYPHTWAGLVDCFTMGLPFYRSELAADFLFNGIFFLFDRSSSLFMNRTFATCSFKKD